MNAKEANEISIKSTYKKLQVLWVKKTLTRMINKAIKSAAKKQEFSIKLENCNGFNNHLYNAFKLPYFISFYEEKGFKVEHTENVVSTSSYYGDFSYTTVSWSEE